MTLQTTKEHLVQLLSDQDNKVIALSGKWGTGKSHLWREVKSTSKDEAVRGALYVSLFGLRDLNQIKLKVVQSSLPSADKHSVVWERARVGIEGARKLLSSLHKGFSALDDLALLAVPSLLKDKVIVLDDIERKHTKLDIDEVLGFIDEFTLQHGARFVLIMNSDQLGDRTVWETLREKVVDQEVRLSTSTSEAFSIAIGLTPSAYAARVQAAAEHCGLTNIRILRKVIKAVNRILGSRLDLSDELLARVIPSTVLLAAIHYKGLDDGPDFGFVLSHGTIADWSKFHDENEAEDEDSKRKAKWKLLVHELGIQSCDDYELLVIEFLQSGLFDQTAVAAIIDRYAEENEVMTTRNDLAAFFDRLIWEHRLTEADLLAEAEKLLPRVHLISVYNFTALHDAVAELPGGCDLAAAMLTRWITAFRAKNFDDFDSEDSLGRKVHPAIQAEFDAIKTKAQAKLTVLEACEFIAKNSGWNLRHELAMKAATVADFEAAIKNADSRRLRLLMRRMLEMTAQPDGYRAHFGEATDRFAEACKNIVQEENSGRLGELIQSLFRDSKLSQMLEPIGPTKGVE